ncbi:hypothetical protein Ahia01_000110600 [Argonauta hians]
MPIRLENMGAVDVSHSSQKDIDWLSRGIEETLQIHQQRNHCETGHNLPSVSPPASCMPMLSCGNSPHVPIVHDDLIIPANSCKAAQAGTWLPYVLPSVRDRHLNRLKNNWRHGLFKNSDNNKWVVKRLNHKNVVSRRKKSYVCIEDMRARNSCNTDYKHHQKLLSTQTLIQEAVRRLYGLHSNTGSSTINNGINNNTASDAVMSTNTTDTTNINNTNSTSVGHNNLVSLQQDQQLLLLQQNCFRDDCEFFCDVTV